MAEEEEEEKEKKKKKKVISKALRELKSTKVQKYYETFKIGRSKICPMKPTKNG